MTAKRERNREAGATVERETVQSFERFALGLRTPEGKPLELLPWQRKLIEDAAAHVR